MARRTQPGRVGVERRRRHEEPGIAVVVIGELASIDRVDVVVWVVPDVVRAESVVAQIEIANAQVERELPEE